MSLSFLCATIKAHYKTRRSGVNKSYSYLLEAVLPNRKYFNEYERSKCKTGAFL